MYHYQKNIGDYRSATMHFSLLEHGIYNQLLDWYYLDEKPLPLENRTLFRRLSAETEEEQKAVIDVVSEMFDKTETGYVHKRVEREIAQYKAKAEQARSAGKLGGRPSKKGVGSAENRDGYFSKPDAKPTANHKPITNNQSTPPTPLQGDDEDFSKFWSTYPRKVGKDAARKAFHKRRFSPEQLGQVLAAVQAQSQTEQWKRDDGQYIPHPATWLNAGRWQDEEKPATSGSTSRPDWAITAGFANRWEAENAGCFERNAHQFFDGKRIEVQA